MSEGMLIDWLRELQAGDRLTDDDITRVQRVIMALRQADKHHRQARGLTAKLDQLREKLAASQTPLEPDVLKVLYDNLWDLYE